MTQALNNVANGIQTHLDCLGFVRLALGAAGDTWAAAHLDYPNYTLVVDELQPGDILSHNSEHVAIFLYEEAGLYYYIDQCTDVYSDGSTNPNGGLKIRTAEKRGANTLYARYSNNYFTTTYRFGTGSNG